MGTLYEKFRLYRPHWDWERMKGSAGCLKWNLQDLAGLDVAIQLTPHRHVAVQAGGNLGIFAKRLAEEFAAVYTFEPDPELFAYLEHNAPEKNIVPICAALGNSNEPISMARGRRDESGRDVHEGLTYVAGAGSTPQMKLDDLQLKDCDLIYFDIEGYELLALQGAEQTIKRLRPTVAVEVTGNAKHYGASRDDIRRWLTERGYERRGRMNGDEIYTSTRGPR